MIIDRPEQWSAERIIGLDLSKKTFQGCILLKKEQYAKPHRISGMMSEEGRLKFISTLTANDWVGIEGGTSSSTFARAILNNSRANVYMLNPGKLHIIFQSMCKTDKKDAVLIANYLRDCHPSQWVLIPIPTEEESAMRSLVTNQIFLKENAVQYVNKLHALFNQAGYPQISKSDLKDNCKRINLIHHYFGLESTNMHIANILNDQINLAELAEETIEDTIKREILIKYPELSLPWLSIPGVGVLTAAACIAFIGDGSRFESPAQVRDYVGLVPRKDQSGIQDKQLGVSRFGCKPIRRNIIQAAWRTSQLRGGYSISSIWEEQAHKSKGKVAVAVANKMLTIGWTLIKRCELYKGVSDYSYLNRKLAYNKLTAIDKSIFPELS